MNSQPRRYTRTPVAHDADSHISSTRVISTLHEGTSGFSGRGGCHNRGEWNNHRVGCPVIKRVSCT